MVTENKKPGNWPEALQMADDIETVANLALTRILALVGGRRLIDAEESDYQGLVLCSPERITNEIMGRERRIQEAIRLLELRDIDRALKILRSY